MKLAGSQKGQPPGRSYSAEGGVEVSDIVGNGGNPITAIGSPIGPGDEYLVPAHCPIESGTERQHKFSQDLPSSLKAVERMRNVPDGVRSQHGLGKSLHLVDGNTHQTFQKIPDAGCRNILHLPLHSRFELPFGTPSC